MPSNSGRRHIDQRAQKRVTGMRGTIFEQPRRCRGAAVLFIGIELMMYQAGCSPSSSSKAPSDKELWMIGGLRCRR